MVNMALSWLLTHPIIEFSFLAYPDLPYHIIHDESLFTFANLLSHHSVSSFLFVSFPFFLFFLFLFFRYQPGCLCTYCRRFMDIDADETLKFRGRAYPLCLPPSVTLSKTRSLNGSQVLMTCRASSWS